MLSLPLSMARIHNQSRIRETRELSFGREGNREKRREGSVRCRTELRLKGGSAAEIKLSCGGAARRDPFLLGDWRLLGQGVTLSFRRGSVWFCTAGQLRGAIISSLGSFPVAGETDRADRLPATDGQSLVDVRRASCAERAVCLWISRFDLD